MDNEILQQGLDLMLYGMGSVLVFLTILVVVTVLMSVLMGRFFPEPEVELPPRNDTDVGPAAIDDKLLTVIRAALVQHRDKRK